MAIRFRQKIRMDFSRYLQLLLAVSLVTALFRPSPSYPLSPPIAHERTNYSCSMEVIKNKPKQNTPIQTVFPGNIFWARYLNINRMLPTKPGKEDKQTLAFLNSRENKCNKTFLFLPVPPLDLAFPTVEVLPNRQVCANRRLLKNKCMPNDPVAFPMLMRWGNVGSLIISSS